MAHGAMNTFRSHACWCAIVFASRSATRAAARRNRPGCSAENRNIRLGTRRHPRARPRQAGQLSLQVVELASPEAGKIALRAGNADIIVSDWLWVSRERALGAKLTFYPYSSALGAVMVPASSPIRTLADLKGRKLAVAGGPIDKSWLLLQAVAEAGRHRPEDGCNDRLRRAAAAGGKDAQRRNGRDRQLLEFLRRAGSEGLSPRRRHRGPAAETRRQGPHRDDRLRLRRGMGARQTATRWRASSP